MSLLFIPPENSEFISANPTLQYTGNSSHWKGEYHEKFSLKTVIDDEVRLTCPIKLIVAPSRLLATVKRGQIVVNRDQIAAQSRHFKLASFISRLCINLKFQNWIKSFKIGSKFNFRISFRFLQNQKFSIWTWPKLKFEFLFQKLHYWISVRHSFIRIVWLVCLNIVFKVYIRLKSNFFLVNATGNDIFEWIFSKKIINRLRMYTILYILYHFMCIWSGN